jgi:DNA-binding response OmpR family regulator
MKKPILLIVEDSASLSNTLTTQCRRYYRVSQVPTIQSAFSLCAEKTFDLVLLDRFLPDGDGTDFIEFLNRHQPITRICLMSSAGELPDRVFGLNRGADAYLPKPFSPTEALAVLRALLRRNKVSESNVLQQGAVELHLGPNLLIRDSRKVQLTPRETEFLSLFFHSTSSFLSQKQIQDWFWKNNLEASTAHIHVYAQRARKKLQQIRGTIVAHYGTGYELKILE